MNVLVIEDEAISARELSGIISAVEPGANIVATLESIEQTIAWLNHNPQPDLIFSDIQLADGLSFEIYEKVKINCPIIFCTAFDEYLMSAFDTNAISYLLKPINKAKVEKAFQKLSTLQQAFKAEGGTQGMERLLSQVKQPYKQVLLVNQREKIIPVQVKDIVYFWLESTIVQVCTIQHQKYFITHSMDELEKTIDPQLFYRANRQFLINRHTVANVERFFSRKLAVKLVIETPETVMVSKTKAVDFLQWLEGGRY
ncbi:LytR/AlgR family response regulator transcription factor [Mucilaginibacter paludis]|uniref:Two component transcriptional regulator, LytTR family n=1 Tax=Mucilaginibacter paludis DSM 18603 TaxID=714943 RepID=H1YG12_9SPHI|nr:LytTR family DNA-binding domain-containing protein [Mucilaginibacter paludis]EHQ26300.1 two component transcriptional regulator, LytTR family [Mucilaginibacter paludis DSM 18603]